MRQVRIVGICALATLAISLGLTATASAGLPEIGRCVKVSTPKTGEFGGARCHVKSATHTGEYNWLPGPAEGKGTIAHRIQATKFETKNRDKNGCSFIVFKAQPTRGKPVKSAGPAPLQGCGR